MMQFRGPGAVNKTTKLAPTACVAHSACSISLGSNYTVQVQSTRPPRANNLAQYT